MFVDVENDSVVDTSSFTTSAVVARASRTKIDRATAFVRAEWVRRLAAFNQPGDSPPVSFSNNLDGGSPPLNFQLIYEYVYGEGVEAPDPGAVVGCENCRPHMGQNCGCEYTTKCECLEYAEVDEARLNAEQRELYAIVATEGGSTLGLPKRFPYHKASKLLVAHYLNSRYPIYE
jgi:histone-lysine N-methyltransferase SUV39H